MKGLPGIHKLQTQLLTHAFNACIQVAAKALEAGVFGAYFNVVTNLKDVMDEDFRKDVGRPSSS